MGTLPVEVGKCVSSDVIRSSVDGGNANVPGGTHGGSRRGTIDVITSLLGGGRVGIDVMTSFVCGENVAVPGGTHGGWRGNVSAT